MILHFVFIHLVLSIFENCFRWTNKPLVIKIVVFLSYSEFRGILRYRQKPITLRNRSTNFHQANCLPDFHRYVPNCLTCRSCLLTLRPQLSWRCCWLGIMREERLRSCLVSWAKNTRFPRFVGMKNGNTLTLIHKTIMQHWPLRSFTRLSITVRKLRMLWCNSKHHWIYKARLEET